MIKGTERTRLSPALLIGLAVILLGATARPVVEQNDAVDPSFLQALRWRLVGPYRGGRVLGVAGVPGDSKVYYFGAAGGGLWKTTDGGVVWKPIFDEQNVAAIGAIAVSESDPNVIYVGTGEACIRINSQNGDGVYKSVDGGKTWIHLGLEDTHHIGKVAVHPRDPDLVLVAALGHTYGENPERGIYRTTDGGLTWEKVLHENSTTGGIDVTFDPNNPHIAFAALWEAHRTPYSLSSGGPGSGLYRSRDGGLTWERLTGHGLPEGIWGKAGVAVSPARSVRIYALIEAEEGGLYRSDDGGDTWQHMNRSHELSQRAWYFMHVIPDPRDADTLYVLNIDLLKSIDGGRNFETLPQYHGDHHALWIDPQDPKRMVSGNDGGANVSLDGGKTWTRSDNNQPTGQFYHVSTDDRFNYKLYGNQQDYKAVAIASRSDLGGITASDWHPAGGCEMGFSVADPRNPDIVYSGCTDGRLTRYNHRTRHVARVDPWPEMFLGQPASEAKYRFQWTAPVLFSPHDPGVLYFAANVVFKTTNGGETWTPMSPDLTRDDKSKQGRSGGPITGDNVGSEYYCTIFALAESPVEKNLLWAGSDDGLVHVTRDGGENWVNVTPPDMPDWGRIMLIDPSPHDAATAYVAVDRHKLDDFKPYAYKTNDYGKTWRAITAGIPNEAFVRVVREDPDRRGLLFAGTERGVYVSFDDGARWQTLQLNLPMASIHDLVVKDSDLVAATYGRAFWILDDVTPLREVSGEVASAPAHLFSPRPAYRFRSASRPKTPAGENPPAGAILYYSLKSEPKDEIRLAIVDVNGQTVRAFTAPSPDSELGTRAGSNRFVWDLRYPGPPRVPGAVLIHSSLRGPMALPGLYQVQLTVDGSTLTAPLEVRSDPRISATRQDLEARFNLHRELTDRLSTVANAINGIRDLRRQLTALTGRIEADQESGPVLGEARRIVEKITAVENALTQPKLETREADAFNFPPQLDNKLSHLMDVVDSSDAAPTEAMYAVYENIWGRVEVELGNLNAILTNDVPKLNELIESHRIPPVSSGKGVEKPSSDP